MVDSIREALASLEHRMDVRFEAVDRRFEAMDRRLDGFEQRVDKRLGSLEDRMTRQFFWLVGIQVTTLTAIVLALVAR